MPNPRAQRPLSLQAVTEDIRSLAQPAQAMLDMLAGAAKGSVSATAGIGGDIESLGRGALSAVRAPSGQRLEAFSQGMEQPTVLPTTENISARLPAVVPTNAPLSRQHSAGYGQTMGEFIPTPGSGAVAQGALRAVKSIPAALQHGAQEFAKASAMGVPHVVKPKGGNWFGNNVEHELKSLKKYESPTAEDKAWIAEHKANWEKNPNSEARDRALRAIENDIAVNERNEALNNWVDRNLTNYVKKEMATPEDPVRKLAEQGVTHFPIAGEPDYWARHGRRVREDLGGEAMAQSPLAKQWENRTDAMITRDMAQEHQDMMHLSPGMYSNKDEWIKKLAPDTPLYSADQNKFNQLDLGFDHIIDVLREDLAAGRIRPEQLNKVSMEQAVRRTYEYDQEMAKKMREAAIKQTEGMPVHKEYPEGYKWIELKANKNLPSEDDGFGNMSSPGYEDLEKALKYEGNTMGHCVGGYCDDVYEGRSRIYSLRDAKGEPHVTVEVKPQINPYLGHSGNITDKGLQLIRQKFPESNFDTEYGDWFRKSGSHSMHFAEGYAPWLKQNHPEIYEATIGAPMGQNIVQIKGKQNAAPKEQYLPYVQDFVRGGEWSDVGDLQNTGLRKLPSNKYVTDKELSALASRHYPEHPNMTPADVIMHYERMKGMPDFQNDATKKFIEDLESGNYLPPEGMKRGGKVSVSDNCDCMHMELNDKKMAGGGVTKLARLSRAPAKSKEEIRAVAERIAPQITGEFVRGEKGTQSVAGKTQKQFAREKELKHDIRGEMPAPGTIDYEKLKDQVVIGIPGDPTITGKSLHAVGETPLESPSPQHGGPLYGMGRDDSSFWASQLGAAKRVQNLAREVGQQYDQPVLGQYIMMGPESINYAQHFADANLSAIDPTKMTKKQIEGFNKLLREGSPASGPRHSFPGIENKEDAYLYMAVDPELRKHFNALMQMPTITERFNLPSGIDVRHAVTEPALRDLETGVTGYSVGQMRPEIEDLKLSSHPTYSHDIPGHFLGQSKQPIPYEIMFPDTLKAIRENPKQAPHEFGSLKMVGPRQTIDQQMIDEIKMYEEMVKSLTGKAAGGAISKAALTAMERLKELKAEAALKSDVWKAKQAADEAKYTQDIQPLTPEMMRAEIERMQNPVKKAAGGEITADDLTIEERPL